MWGSKRPLTDFGSLDDEQAKQWRGKTDKVERLNIEVEERVEKLVKLWDSGENVEFAYHMTLLYNIGDPLIISKVVDSFTNSIKELYAE